MAKFVIVGQSPAVVSAVKALRSRETAAEIVILSCDGQKPYDRTRLVDLVGRKVKEKDLFLESEDFYTGANVQVCLDKEITRINFNRHKIFFSGKTQLDYDFLLLADAPQIRWPELKGLKRSGVFTLARLDQVRSLVRYLPFMETVIIQLSGLEGLALALALQSLGKEVIVMDQAARLLPAWLDESSSDILSRMLAKHSIRVMPGNQVVDVLGDVEVKAVRLKSGKVLACSSLIIEGVTPDLRFLSEGELVTGERIPVTATMCSNVQDVYAIDVMCQMDAPLLVGGYGTQRFMAEQQGEIAVQAMFREDAEFTCALPSGQDVLLKFFTNEEIIYADDITDEKSQDEADLQSELESDRPQVGR